MNYIFIEFPRLNKKAFMKAFLFYIIICLKNLLYLIKLFYKALVKIELFH